MRKYFERIVCHATSLRRGKIAENPFLSFDRLRLKVAGVRAVGRVRRFPAEIADADADLRMSCSPQ